MVVPGGGDWLFNTAALDVASAVLALGLIFLSLCSAASVVYLRLRATRSRRANRILGISTLWPARLLLSLFASLWALAELLPVLLRLLPISAQLPLPPVIVCRTYVILSHSFAEPCFFATLLFLLRASTAKPSGSITSSSIAFIAALISAISAALPFLLLHALYVALAPEILPHLGLSTDLLGCTTVIVSRRTGEDGKPWCANPIFNTALLAAFAAVYIPLFVSACSSALSLVINKRLRLRLYALASTVVAALLLQVAALVIANLWTPGRGVHRALSVAASAAVLICAVIGEGILVFHPVLDALAICEPPLPAAEESYGATETIMEEGFT